MQQRDLAPAIVTVPLDGSPLSPAIDVPVGGLPGPINVTITLPVASWFVSNGASRDPSDAAARARIDANARASVAAGVKTAKEGTEP